METNYKVLKDAFSARYGERGKSIFAKLLSKADIAQSLLQPESDSTAALLISLIKGRKLSYKTDFQGFPISIENRKGDFREWVDHNGASGKTYMEWPYGYIRGTDGADDEHIDVYIGPNAKAEYVYVVDQLVPDTGEFDEQKCFLGFDSPADAKYAYLQHRNDVNAFGGINSFSIDEFREKIKSHDIVKSNIKHKEDDICYCGATYQEHFNDEHRWKYPHYFRTREDDHFVKAENKHYMVGIDFDNTLTNYNGFVGFDQIPDQPLDGAIEFLRSLILDKEIKPYIFSSRATKEEGAKAIHKWLLDHGLSEEEMSQLEITGTKQAFHYVLDDRTDTFTGVYPNLAHIKNFKLWNGSHND